MKQILYAFILFSLALVGCRTHDEAPAAPVSDGVLLLENDGIKIDVVSTGVPTGVECIYFSDALTGIAATKDGKVFQTRDGGASWDLRYTNPSADQPWRQLLFTDPQVGYAVGGNIACNGTGCGPPYGRIAKTTDGGASWTSVLQTNDADVLSIAANDAGELFAVSCNSTARILRSANAGQTWTVVANLPFRLTKIAFDRNLGLCTSATGTSGKVVKSVNNGQAWTVAATFTYPYLNELAVNAGIGYCVEGYGKVYKTTDGGSNWDVTSSSRYSALVVNALTPTSGLIFGAGQYSGGDFGVYNGSVRQTSDAGGSWAESTLPGVGPIGVTSFYTAKNGYAVSSNKLIRVQVK